MGDAADMMLQGILCEGCGEYIDDGNDGGFPRYCSDDCAKGRGVMDYQPSKPSRSRARQAEQHNIERQDLAGKKFCCQSCSRRFRSAHAVEQHHRDVHGRS